MLRSETYNLVVLDLTLPDLDGKAMLPAGIALLGYTQRGQQYETANPVSLGLLCKQQDITERRSRG